MTRILAAAIAATTLAAAAPASAQNVLNMDLTRSFNAQVQWQNDQFAQIQRGMVQGNLANPQVMAAYRAGVCGPGLTPQQFALKYAQLGGCTPQGYGNWMNTSNGIARQQQLAWTDYQGAVQNRRDAMGGLFAGQQRIATDRGRLLQGCGYRTYPNGFTQWVCP